MENLRNQNSQNNFEKEEKGERNQSKVSRLIIQLQQSRLCGIEDAQTHKQESRVESPEIDPIQYD